ncbi:MAG TPA: TldD/PmbA family protein [Firmicutes bacterium]|nr:TldD/PmbA family protein [Candidatus Fermentithermobacillaceae bacterium]
MRDPKKLAKSGLDALLKAGAEKAQCLLSLTDKHEMNVDAGELSLFRTTFDTRLSMTAIKGQKKGSSSVNKADSESIEKAAAEALAIADASQPDEANDIAAYQVPQEFSAGSDSPDFDRMHYRLKELLNTVRARYPKIVLRQAYLDFTRERRYLVNSNGVDFVSTKGVYRCFIIFSSRDGEKVSSFNYTGVAMKDLEKEIIECGSIDILLRQSTEQIITRSVGTKFVGDVIVAPDCLEDVLGFLTASISDRPVISGTSIYKDKLNQPVASPLLTVHSKPVSDEICDGYFLTQDGYAARNSTIVDRGILRTFLLSLYGSRKTGKERSVNDGRAFVVEPGHTSFEDMVKAVKKGILLVRFSGGRPNENGDFAGVAKNSYYIEDGEIKYPISETMISGNFAQMLRNITAVSSERIDYGFAVLPWVAFSGVVISGK